MKEKIRNVYIQWNYEYKGHLPCQDLEFREEFEREYQKDNGEKFKFNYDIGNSYPW